MFKAERELLLPEKTKYRDSTINATRSFMEHLDSFDFNHIPERITQEQLQALSSDLLKLVNSLPRKGSLKYKFLPPECKTLLNKVVDDIIQVPAVNKEYKAYMKTVSDISMTYSGSQKHQIANQNIADEDIRTRLCNSVLKSATTLSLIQKQALSSELSSPHGNNDIEMNSVQPSDENSQMNSVHLTDEEFFQMSSAYLNDDDSQVNSVHLNDEEFFQMSSAYLNDDDSQVNSVHLTDENSQVNSVHLINGKIRDDIHCSVLEWTDDFKNRRKELYSLDNKDPDYVNKFNIILDSLISYHNQGNMPATYLLARLYNSKAYPVYDKQISEKLYTLSYNNFTYMYNQPYCSLKNDRNSHTLSPEQQTSFLSYHLGKMSERGYGCEVNYNDAIAYYKNCANDNAYAQYSLANIYLSEKVSPLTPELYATALYLLEKASSKNPFAAYQYAQHLENPVFPSAPIPHITKAGIHHYYETALNGFLSQTDDANLDGSILYKIGKIYYEGKGCEKDAELAYEYFTKAAECKNKNAYYALGKTYADKTSSHYDPVCAEQYYLKAYNEYIDPETGEAHIPSYLKIAMADLYANHEHEIYDIDKAINIYKDCIKINSSSIAMFKLGYLYLNGNGNGVEKNIKLGLQYLNDAVYLENKFAKITLADFYADSSHSQYNIMRAIQLYKDCIINESDSYSMSKLGSIYLFGNGVPKNEALGLKYLNDAIAHGNEHAKKTIEFYNNMKHSMAISAAFSLVYHFLSTLNDSRNQDYLLRINSNFRSTSKEARIDAYRKNKEHSSANYEQE